MSSEITIRLSGGPNRDTFTYKGKRLTQAQLTSLLSEIPGIRVSKSQGGGGFDFILVPDGTSASKTALSYSNPATDIMTLGDFIGRVLSPGNAHVLESKIIGPERPKPTAESAVSSSSTLIPLKETAIEDYFSGLQQYVRINTVSDTLGGGEPISLRSYRNASEMSRDLEDFMRNSEIEGIELYDTAIRVHSLGRIAFSTWIFPNSMAAQFALGQLISNHPEWQDLVFETAR